MTPTLCRSSLFRAIGRQTTADDWAARPGRARQGEDRTVAATASSISSTSPSQRGYGTERTQWRARVRLCVNKQSSERQAKRKAKRLGQLGILEPLEDT